MRVLLATLTVLAGLSTVSISTADAGTTCRMVLNSMVCTSTSGQTTTCRRVLNSIVCN